MKTVSVIEFGAYGDGMHDDCSAFQAAFDCGADEILIPQGIYCISDTLKIRSNTTVIADHGAKIAMKSASRRKRGDFLLSNADVDAGNVNICIKGGIWDGNNTSPENAKPDLMDKGGYSGAVLNFVNISGLRLENMVIANSVTYYVRMSQVQDFTIENIDLVSDHFGANQDGIHVGGGVKRGHIRNVRALSFGQTNDDMIALNADDSIERVENLDLVRDAIEDLEIENIYTESCHTIIRMLSVTAPIRNVKIKNVYGGFRCYAINADAARYCRTPLFKDIDHPTGVGLIENVSIENFTCYPSKDLPNGFGGSAFSGQPAIVLESNATNFTIENFKYQKAAGDQIALLARNIVDTKILADQAEYEIKEKSDKIVIDNFQNLKIN